VLTTPTVPFYIVNQQLLERTPLKIRPLHDRVMVKRLEEERTSPGGIVIPTQRREAGAGKDHRGRKGKILEKRLVRPLIGSRRQDPCSANTAKQEVKVDGEELVVMREEDVMAVIEGK